MKNNENRKVEKCRKADKGRKADGSSHPRKKKAVGLLAQTQSRFSAAMSRDGIFEALDAGLKLVLLSYLNHLCNPLVIESTPARAAMQIYQGARELAHLGTDIFGSFNRRDALNILQLQTEQFRADKLTTLEKELTRSRKYEEEVARLCFVAAERLDLEDGSDVKLHALLRQAAEGADPNSPLLDALHCEAINLVLKRAGENNVQRQEKST